MDKIYVMNSYSHCFSSNIQNIVSVTEMSASLINIFCIFCARVCFPVNCEPLGTQLVKNNFDISSR